MRISQIYIDAIKQYAYSIFGSGTKVFLFGSRVDDSRKGGDIDLYIVPDNTEDRKKLFTKKIAFLTQLKSIIGEQKIDVLIAKDAQRTIEVEAMRTGIVL